MGRDAIKDVKILIKELTKLMNKHGDRGTISIKQTRHLVMKCEFDGKPFAATLSISPSNKWGVKKSFQQVRKGLIECGIKPTDKLNIRLEPTLTDKQREKEEDFDKFFDLLEELIGEDDE